MSWTKLRSYLVMGDLIDPLKNSPYAFSPRNILQTQINELTETGYKIKGASELEYFLYNKNYRDNYHKVGLTHMKEYGSHPEDYLIQQGDRMEHIYGEFRKKLKESGLEVETTKGEASIGQHEINFAYDDSLAMSDSVLVLKSVYYY